MSNNLIRIQKVFSDNGVLSRRKAEEAVSAGRVTVNGRKAKIGQPVDAAKDLIALDGQILEMRKNISKVYIMLNKPRGYVTTMQDELGRKCVADITKYTPVKVYPIGRLDKQTEGMLLMTNDGEFANLVMHPSNDVPKTYRVTVRPDITDQQAAKLSAGVTIEGRMTKPAKINILEKEQGRVVMLMTITEGRNRQIRKMCEAVGLEVARLKRVSVGPLKLGMLKPGTWRELEPSELNILKTSIKQSIESVTSKEQYLNKLAPQRPAFAKQPSEERPFKSGGFKNTKSKSEFKGTKSKSEFKGTKSKSEFKGTKSKSEFKDTKSMSEFKDTKSKSEFKGTKSKSEFKNTKNMSEFKGTKNMKSRKPSNFKKK